jgi:LuxR family maltose regulon positive regulatory protein
VNLADAERAQDCLSKLPILSASADLLLSSKLAPPNLLPEQIERKSLLDRLKAWQSYRLTLITAPTGYGKSTLISQFVREIEMRLPDGVYIAWLTLDTEDNDLAQFLNCLAATLTGLIPAFAAAAIAAIKENRLQKALHLLLAGVEQVASPVIMVLDDFHHIQSSDVQQVVAAAITRGPASCHWMVMTRHVPPARLIGKLRLQRQILELNADELRLSHTEIKLLIERFKDFQLDDEAINLLEQHAQGWTAGIYLALLSLQRSAGGPMYTAQNVIGHLRGNNRLLAQYLTSEVLTNLPDPLRSFLLQCSILDRLHADLCRIVTGQEDSAFLLEQAVEEQIFIRISDVEGQWYEQHPMFRELLQRQLRLQLSPVQLLASYHTVANWFLERNDVAQALRYLVSGGDQDQAAALLSRYSRSALLDNRQTELRSWFSLLPDAAFNSQPQLLLDRCWLALISASNEFITALTRAEEVMAKRSDLPAAWRDELAVLQLWRRQISDEQTDVYVDALKTVAHLAPESALARGWCWLATLFTHSTHPGGSPTAEHAQAAAMAFTDAGYDMGLLQVSGWQAKHYAALGEAPAALAVCQQAHQIIAAQEYPVLDQQESFDFLAGSIYYWSDSHQEAIQYFQRALDNARTRNDALPILRASACLHLCELALDKAVTLTDGQIGEESTLWRSNEQAYTDSFKGEVVLWQIQRWLRLGRLDDAWGAYQQLGVTLETMSVNAPDTLWMATLLTNVALGRNLVVLTPHLQRLLTQSERNNLRLTAIRVRLLWVHQQQQLGYHSHARMILRQAMHDIERTGYVRLLLDYPAILPVIRAVDTHYARSVVVRMDVPAQSLIVNKLTNQESVILEHLVHGAKINDIATSLVVSPGTVKWHLSNLYTKLGVKNQREAVRVAQQMQILAK